VKLLQIQNQNHYFEGGQAIRCALSCRLI